QGKRERLPGLGKPDGSPHLGKFFWRVGGPRRGEGMLRRKLAAGKRCAQRLGRLGLSARQQTGSKRWLCKRRRRAGLVLAPRSGDTLQGSLGRRTADWGTHAPRP